MAMLDARETKTFPISAVTGSGVEEALNWIIKRIKMNSKPPYYS